MAVTITSEAMPAFIATTLFRLTSHSPGMLTSPIPRCRHRHQHLRAVTTDGLHQKSTDGNISHTLTSKSTTHFPTSSSAHQNGSSAASPPPLVKRTAPVELRPELVGGVPLWLLIGAMTKLSKMAKDFASISSIRTARTSDSSLNGSEQKNNEPVAKQFSPSTALHLMARHLEEELSDLKTQVLNAQHETRNRDTDVQSLRAQLLYAESRLAELNMQDKDENEYKSAHETTKRLFSALCATQTKATAAEKQLAEMTDLVTVLQQERDAAKEDVVKAVAVFVLFMFLVGGFIGNGSTVAPWLYH